MESVRAPSQMLYSDLITYSFILVKEIKRLGKIEGAEEDFASHWRKGVMYCDHSCNVLIWGRSPNHSNSKAVFEELH